jgi:hypothetical protein
MGGRVGENVGFVLEAQLADANSPMFASFKMPIAFQTRLGRIAAIPFTTDGLGAPFGFEVLNTGAVANTRMLEAGAALYASQYVVGGQGKAEGVALVMVNDKAFVNFTPWTPTHGTVALDHPAWYLRAGVTPRWGTWDFALGFQRWNGTAQVNNQRAEAWALDLQVQGQHAGRPVGLYAGYARASGSAPPQASFLNPEARVPGGGVESASPAGTVFIQPPTNTFNSAPSARDAISVVAEVGAIPRRVTVAAGMRLGHNGQATMSSDRTGTLGVTYLVAQNIQFQVNQMFYGGDAWAASASNRETIFMIFAAF